MLSPRLTEALLEFRRERDWEQFHSPRSLSAALCVEAAELLDHFRWARDGESETIVEQHRAEIESEIADVAILLSYLVHDLGVSLDDAVAKKLELNRAKYPIEKSKGTSRKYNQI
jgi:NTP pyrophosphatase (non-canonical NTP hydrolase)